MKLSKYKNRGVLSMSNERKRFAETYGGIVGAAMPMVAMLGGILVLAAMGMRSTKKFLVCRLFSCVGWLFGV